MNLQKLITRGELAREKEQNDKALYFFDLAIDQAIKNKDYNAVLSALTHKLLVWKHEYHRTNDPTFLELMVADARAGYEIGKQHKVSKDNLASMLLRIGHYHLFRKEFKQAEEFSKQAIKFVNTKSRGRYAEFLGHYALAAALTHKHWQRTMDKAFAYLNTAKELRAFHKLVIESGLYMRLSVIAAYQNNELGFQTNLAKAKLLAEKLSKQYKMNLRLGQTKRLQKEPKWIF